MPEVFGGQQTIEESDCEFRFPGPRRHRDQHRPPILIKGGLDLLNGAALVRPERKPEFKRLSLQRGLRRVAIDFKAIPEALWCHPIHEHAPEVGWPPHVAEPHPALGLDLFEMLHAGLVILIPNVDRVLQQRLFRAALDELATLGEPVNRVLEIDLDGEDVTLSLYDLP